jgi:hypothetical protein
MEANNEDEERLRNLVETHHTSVNRKEVEGLIDRSHKYQ